MSRDADSAGIPFAGREFRPHPFVGDDGSAPPVLQRALSNWQEHKDAAGLAGVVEALRGQRLLVPLLAEAGDIGYTPEGKKVEKTQELSIAHVAGPDGQPVGVAFSDVASLTTWRADARPIPLESEKVLAWVLDEHMTRLVLNPSTATQCVLRRGPLVAFLRGKRWTAPWEDPAVLEALSEPLGGGPARLVSVESGWDLAGGEGPDLLVTISLTVGLSEAERRTLQQSWAENWSSHPVINQMVEGIRLKLVAS